MNRVKRIVAIILTLNTFGSTLLVPLIYLDFNLRRDYIAEVLCIKREEPIEVCGGQCYLDFKLGEAGDLEQESTSPNRQLAISFYREQTCTVILNDLAFTYQEKIPLFGQLLPTSTFVNDVFHPPKIV